jgi:predicted nuclease of predicted toxin-antitoxin system
MAARGKKSKKRSATSSKQPDEFVFFIDRSLGKKAIANVLRKAGARVEVHDDHLPQNARDEEWLTYAGQRHWAVITKDDRIRYH